MRPKESDVYKRIRLLGQGSFGKAYLCECLKDHSLCVIKQMDMRYLNDQEKKETYREFRIMSELKHPNIINFREVYKTVKGKLCIVMDYAEGGDLAQVLKNTDGYIAESRILDWFTQMCLAIKHCHDRKIIHRDIKTQNMFLTKDMRIRLGDFGIARLLNNTRDKAKTMVGTPYYLAPELLENKPYSFKGDIWSLGVILYEMCAKTPPFTADSLAQLALKIVRGQFQAIPNIYSSQLRTLVNQLLTVNPEKRPAVHQILKMPIITNRIKNFLSETMKRSEFDHTILHNQQIHLSDTTIPLIDDQDAKGDVTEQTSKENHIKQLPGIRSPAINLQKQRKNSDLKKLPEIKLSKPERPPITRQQTSRQQLNQNPNQRALPSTPEVGILSKQKNGRFITKESPDSYQGSDQVIEEGTKYSEQESPKFFKKNLEIKPHIKNLKGLTKLDQIQKIKLGLKSEDECKKPIYRVHAQPKMFEQKKQQERKVSEEIVSSHKKQEELQNQQSHLEKISETPEQKLLNQSTISDFQNSEENQDNNKKQSILTPAFEIHKELQYQVLDIIQKKPVKIIKESISKTDEEKNKKKIYKIIYKDPFQKKPAQKRNSEEDMKEMINELKNVLSDQQKKLEEPNLQNEIDSEDSRIYSEESSDDLRDDADTLPPQTQVNTWMQSNSEAVNISKSQPEPRKKISSNQRSLKDKLVVELGQHFEQLFRLAKLCSHQEDLGKQHIKMAIMDNLRIDENRAEICATLLVTLATIGY
ncbi:unnamed protein product (macronuclear) [Paramecium tetraurelia]|uniref:non-specific serine/threonine protein kinase n=1 Tax=Paramecium tetraurelia TaxID=5888 RepID=A0C942_PARTE|nr:uncharacterized protein GSPATT00006615001 [Paramecium tetraurelia]CAK67309.1 unnamed protein product [Paramecium tetraurelia]|eukprot:XP_001434706.1 hypothetical protein (macronuclear) [Paramecium tetraurelia strain d4-2]